jgi:hypothetical protein
VGHDNAATGNEYTPLTRAEVVAIVGEIRAKDESDASRTARQLVVGQHGFTRLLLSAAPGELCAFDDVARANKARVGLIQLPDDDSDGVMHPVGEIAIEVAGWPKHGLVTVRLAAVGMSPRISFAGVRFHLSDTNGDGPVVSDSLQDTAEKCGGDVEGVTSKELSIREVHVIKFNHRSIVPARHVSALCDRLG